MKFCPEIQWFAEAMQNELDANARKGDWREFKSDSNILSEIAWHQAKLLQAIRTGTSVEVLEYAADCANYYMMLANANGIFNLLPASTSDCSPSE